MEVIDLFSGAGGLSLGFKMEGFRILLSIEKDPIYYETFKLNNPDCACLNGNIVEIDIFGAYSRYFKDSNIDGIIGGPPCQGYSSVGNRDINDPRNMFIYYFIKWVKIIKPRFFVMENVPGIISMDRGRVVQKIKKMFKTIGYSCQMELLRALDFGIPQVRKRVFFIGFASAQSTRLNLNINGGKKLTVRDAFSDILDTIPFEGRTNGNAPIEYKFAPKTPYQEYLRKNSSVLLDHNAPNHSDFVKERISFIKPGENHQNLPEKYKLKSGYPNIYGRLHLDKPADTITGNCGCVSAPGRFIHPIQDRAISVREAARLQSIPDDYKFKGNLNQRYRQIGNAVPPLLASAIAKVVKERLLLEN
ncbi:MAG: DNA cytosine methyltransferase [Promethearchaeota archaeon]